MLTDNPMSRNLSNLSGRKGPTRSLLEDLGKAAEVTGTPGPEALEDLRKEYLFGKANLLGAATFYDFLRPENQGKKVYLCNGSACLTAGTQQAVREKLRGEFSEHEIGEMCCLGRCHENNAFQLNGHNHSGKDIDELSQLRGGAAAGRDHYQVRCHGTPVLTAAHDPVTEYHSILTACLNRTPEDLLSELRDSALRGRGGAGFPTAFKLEACRNATGETKFIVCNADEGDPGAYSDRFILEQRPHALLMGMMLAGYITGAAYGIVYIRGEYPEAVDSIRQGIADLDAENLLGAEDTGCGFHFEFKVIKAQGAYICGEETALLSSIEGQRPEVRVRPPYPTQQGLFNQPTMVSNVETLANIPFIMRQGGKAFAAIGTPQSAGTKLISLDGHFNRPGICEVDMGTPLRTVINELGGGFRRPVKALHIGGPLGGLVPVDKADGLTVDFDSFAKAGFLLGHASVVCIPEEYPLIRYLEHLFRFTAHESCGKCFPCRLGSTRGYEMLAKAQRGDYQIDRHLITDLLETLELGSLCALGGGLPLPVRNALEYFDAELSVYFKS